MRLMSERQRIQGQYEKRQKKAVRVSHLQRPNNEEHNGEEPMAGDLPEESRPGTGASTSSVDQDTRGVLRMMHTADKEQLLQLRESLTSHIERRPQPRLSQSGRSSSKRILETHSRPHSSHTHGEQSRPSSSSSAIASAIQAENQRVKRITQGVAETAETPTSLGHDLPRPSSRSGSKPARQRLPLSPEVAAECAPPSVLTNSPGRPRAQTPQSSSSRLPVGQTSGTSSQLAPGTAEAAVMLGYPERGTTPQATDSAPQVSVQGAPSSGKGQAAAPEEFADRVSRLDRRKQKALLRVLESLESDVSDSTVRIRVLSNWGDPRQCGLSQIEALDSAAEVLLIPPAAVSLRGTQSGSTTVSRMVEGRAATTNEKFMWAGTVCPKLDGDGQGFEPFEIALNLPATLTTPAALRFWNFNGTGGLDKGARGVEVWRAGQCVWTGELPRGTGLGDACPSVAPLGPGFTITASALAPVPAAAGAGSSSRAPEAAAPPAPVATDRPIWLEGVPVRGDIEDDGDVPPGGGRFSPQPPSSLDIDCEL
eukprot:CAMPEP_0179293458 /NCGR_PEP_ID=MMETSP0797-20121207/43383_1 /TAXON_ID=47934 /ORGANISM="Dinophysis acuminata, Strain DAEP01" /LENGTH=536 /DNA_ID=CAMNT_0021002605 /DNA_START=81 /DNA_END=1688 /DNA_ORIENTATION=+